MIVSNDYSPDRSTVDEQNSSQNIDDIIKRISD
jgi:hypothetical protein